MLPKILLLEDDKLFNETVEDFLEEEGYVVEVALDPYTALELAFEHSFNLYLFDVNLPYENGFSLLQKLREAGDRTPTIFLTSRSDKASMIEGFTVGADDYMKKPIDLDELALRIRAILRREYGADEIVLGEFRVDCTAKELYRGEEALKISNKAIELLLLFLSAKGEVVRHEEIEESLWHTSEEVSLGSVRVYITTLKKYFPRAIKNIRGIGYRFLQEEI